MRALAILGLALCALTFPTNQSNALLAQSTPPTTPQPADATSSEPTSSNSSNQSQPTSEYTVLQDRGDRIVAQLPNRMIVLAQRVPTAPVTSAQVWVKTGLIYEQEHVGAGLSHYLEHLLSGGSTENRTEAESSAVLGRIGASTNAATSLDTVRYFINTTSDHTETAIDLLSDWMQNSQINQNEFDRERDVILREFSMGRGEPGRILWKLTQQARYTAHPAMHPTIGYEDEFRSITRDEIIDFYHRMYVPNNMVFVVTGDIDPQQTLDQIAQRWTDAEPGELPELSFPVQPESSEPQSVTGYADIQRPRLRLAWSGTQLGQDHDYALDLLAVILGQGESARLTRSVRDEAGVVSSIDAYNLSFPWGKGFFSIDSELAASAENLDAAKSVVLEQVRRLREDGVTSAELDRAKREVMSSVVQSSQTAQGIASRLASDTIGMADPDYLRKYAEAVQSLTPEEIQSAASDLLTDNRLITVRMLPQTPENPMSDMQRPEGLQSLADKLPTKPFELDNAELLDEMQTRLADSQSGGGEGVEVDQPQMFTLDNGLRVIVQRSTVVPAVSMQLYSLGGLLSDAEAGPGTSNAMASMLTRGTESMSAEQINQAVEDLGATLQASSGNNTIFVRASTLKEDWQTILEMMSDVVLRPTFPAEEWQRMQPRLLAAIARQRDSWIGELRQGFRETYFGNHPWSQTTVGSAEVVESLTPEDLAAFHDTQFQAQQSVLTIVGDVDPEAVRRAVTEQFGELTAGDRKGFNPPMPPSPQPKVVQASTDKPITAVQIGYGPGITRDSPDYPGLQVLARLMSDFPSGYLEQALRGQGGGLVYAVSGGVVTGMVPGYFSVLFNTQVPAAPEAIAQTRDVIERVRTELPSETELARAKAKVLSTELLSKQSNSDRAATLALDELYDVDDPGVKAFTRKVNAVTAEDVQQLAEKYLNNPVMLILSNEPIDLSGSNDDANPADAGSKSADTSETPTSETERTSTTQ